MYSQGYISANTTKGYTGKYSILANFVKNYKDEETQKATIRFETNLGLLAKVRPAVETMLKDAKNAGLLNW